jgi:hypothetical protein
VDLVGFEPTSPMFVTRDLVSSFTTFGATRLMPLASTSQFYIVVGCAGLPPRSSRFPGGTRISAWVPSVILLPSSQKLRLSLLFRQRER